MKVEPLTITRLAMFWLICYVYFTMGYGGPAYLHIAVILITCVFTLNHFLLFSAIGSKLLVFICLVDVSMSTILNFMFPGTIYLILFGVIAVTVSLFTGNKKILGSFMALFFLIWLINIVISYLRTNEVLLLDDLISFSFIIFGSIVGRLIYQLHAAQKQIKDQYGQLNDSHFALKDAHEQLQHYSRQVEALTVVQERNRIAREIHDTVGHKMTALLVQLRLAKELQSQQTDQASDTLVTCEQLAKDALQEIRLSVQTLHEKEDDYKGVIANIRAILENYQSTTGLESELEIKGDPANIPISIQPIITRMIQETITNAVRHGQAENCQVTIDIDADAITVSVKDDGAGANHVEPGFGLITMRERVIEHGGNISFEGIAGQGFTVQAKFPQKSMKWKIGGVS
ncbi:sensor histidine kinase [Radiobacillus sp. PE A8.2]|uniref:sensor histidine kinase n=1 Tax=Radiobacillus sp. PE A8.2 TaxID=3380349 RepID=UPI00388D9081